MAVPGIVKLMYRNVKVNVDPGTLIILVGLPAMYLVFFGFGFGTMLPGVGSTAYLIFLTPGIMSFQCVMAGTVGGSMLWADRRWGMLAQILVGPFTRLQYLLGIMSTTLVFGLAGAFVMLVGAFAIIGAPLQVTLWGALTAFGIIAVGSIFFGSLMLLISGLVKSNNAYNSIQILIIFVVDFASTVFYSDSPGLPLPIQALIKVNPLTYVANAARGGFVGALPADSSWQIPLLVVETIVVLAMATRVYVRSEISFV